MVAPVEAKAGGAVRLNLNLKGLDSVKIVQLTGGGENKQTNQQTKTKQTKKIALFPGHRAESIIRVYQGSPVMVSSTHSSQG